VDVVAEQEEEVKVEEKEQ
jgi:hypothetical protein